MTQPQYATAPRGEEHPAAKLTEEDVLYIRRVILKRRRLQNMIAKKYSNAAIAEELNVSQSLIDKVWYRQLWSHVG